MQSRNAQAFASHADFYTSTYAYAIRDMRPAGRSGANLLLVEQDAGDWSDAATPDLVIAVSKTNHGAVSIDFGGGRFGLQRALPGSVAVCAPDFASHAVVETWHALSILSVPYRNLLSLAGEGSCLPEDGDFGRVHRSYSQDQVVTHLVHQMWQETAGGNPHGTLFADGALVSLAARLLSLRDQKKNICKGGLSPQQLRRVTDALHGSLDDKMSLVELAAIAGLSTHHFCRAFKTSTGHPPHRWLAVQRMERAKDLLAGSRLSLTEIAHVVGYSGQGTFGEAFRRVVGVSPGSYRRELLR